MIPRLQAPHPITIPCLDREGTQQPYPQKATQPTTNGFPPYQTSLAMSQTPYGINSWHLNQAQWGVILGGGSAPPLLTAGFAFSPFTAGNSRNSIPKKIKCPPYDGIDPMQLARGVGWYFIGGKGSHQTTTRFILFFGKCLFQSFVLLVHFLA